MKNALLILMFACMTLGYGQHPDVFVRPLPATFFSEDVRTILVMKDIVNGKVNSIQLTKNNEYIGTPYEAERFKPGTVYYKGVKKGDFMLRYNIFAEEFEVQVLSDGNEGYSTIQKSSDISITMDGKDYIYKFYVVDETQQFGYFEVIKELEKTTLLKKFRKLVQEGKTAVTSFDVNRPSRLVDREGYFVLIGDRRVVEVKQSNNQLAKTFKKYGVDVKEYLKKNNLNVKERGDLIEAVAYIDSRIQAE